MRKLAFIILFLLTKNIIIAQSIAGSYTLSIQFEPSFNNPGKLVLHCQENSGTISLSTTYKSITYRDSVLLKANEFSTLTHFLATYQYKITNNIDTIKEKVFNNGDSSIIYHIEGGTDGINVKGKVIQNGYINNFAFWSPKKGSENDQFMGIIFNLMETYFSKDSTINYVEALKDYFPHDLIVRKVSEHPLKYKWYGSVNSDISDSVEAFLKALPLHQKVFIDLSREDGFSSDMYDIIEDYSKRNRNIYWITPYPKELKALYDTDIPHKQILFERK